MSRPDQRVSTDTRAANARVWGLRSLLGYVYRDQRARFLIIGAINTGFGYLSFATLYFMLGSVIHYLGISLLAHAVAVCFAFTLQRRVVFRSPAPWPPEFVRYNISVLGVQAGSMVFLSLLVSGLGWHPLLAQAVVTAGSVVAAYISHRRFSFRCR
jgi:putative flippase GtrA